MDWLTFFKIMIASAQQISCHMIDSWRWLWTTVFVLVMQDIIQATRNLPYIGAKTNTAAALQMLTDVVFQTSSGARDDSQHVAIIVVNGQATVNPSQVKYTACLCSRSFCSEHPFEMKAALSKGRVQLQAAEVATCCKLDEN
jgi:von Willebrand factor type A domain